MHRKVFKVFSVILAFLVLTFSLASFSFAASNDITKVGADVEVAKGVAVGQAVAIGGTVKVAGDVQKDVVAIGGNVVLEESAVIQGDAVAIGGKVQKARGAVVKGDIVELGVPGSQALTRTGLPVWGAWLTVLFLLSMLGVLILALLTVGFFTKQVGNASAACEKRAWRCFWVGVLALILIVPIAVLLLISLVGIVFLPLWIMLVVAGLFFAKVVISQLVGKKLLQLVRITRKPMLLEVIIGLIALLLISMIPLIGGLIKMILVTIAVGAVTLTKFGTAKV